jgi:hypothetical protein
MMASAEQRNGGVTVALVAGAIVLVWSGVCAAQIVNPSFETTALVSGFRLLPLHWGRVDNVGRLDHPSFSSDCVNSWSTDGSRSARMFSRSGKSFVAGGSQSFFQYVDLTGTISIAFDVRLAAYPAGAFDHFEASFLVDDVPLWSETVDGVYLDQQVNVSQFSGGHVIEMRITALDSGTFSTAYWTQWDNLEIIEGPTIVGAFLDLDPDTLNLASNGKWITCYIELAEGYDAMTIDGATVSLGNIPAHMGHEGWATPEASEGNITDLDGNGVPERMVKFDRSAVQAVVQPPEAVVTVTGLLVDGITPFEGTATIKVIGKGCKNTGTN